jgi:UDP-3-O-[3-hydroxymyristoyl] glucosamine N-acyltransferase
MKEHQHPIKYTLSELISGLDITIKGDPNCVIHGVCTINPGKSDHITFLVNPLYKKYLPETQAAAVILLQEDAKDCPTNALICRDPYYVYAKIAAYFNDKPKQAVGIHSTATIGKNCQIHPTVSIGANCTINDYVKLAANIIIEPGCVIGDFSEIDEKSHLHANVTLYHKIKIGKRVSIGSGTVIGSDGFGIAKNKGVWHKVPQLGAVCIGDDVEVGSNCSIDRGAIEDTVIECGVKLDNLIQIGHNVRISENTAMAANVGVSGSTTIGKNCLVGGGAGFAGHLTITDNVVVTGGAAITKSINEAGIYSSGVGGVMTNLEWRKNSARVNRLEHLIERVKALENTLVDIIERKTT